DRRALHRREGAVALSSAALAALVGVLCGGGDVRSACASAQPVRLALMAATQPTGQPVRAPAPPHNPDQPTDGDGAGQPEREGPPLRFLGPRPPWAPFRMDLTKPPEPPFVLELSPFAPGRPVRDRLERVLRAEIARYPSGMLGGVGDIYIGSTLKINGRPASGAILLTTIIFIAAGEQDAGSATDANVVQTFHHEVSSVLLHRHRAKFDETRFRAALPEGFVYRDDRPGADREAPVGMDEQTVSLELLNDGFLIPWATLNMEDDFNSYAQVLMWRPELLLETFAPESRIGRKARVVRDFYLSIDPRFEEMFLPTEVHLDSSVMPPNRPVDAGRPIESLPQPREAGESKSNGSSAPKNSGTPGASTDKRFESLISFAPPSLVPFRMDVSTSPEFPCVIMGTPLAAKYHQRVRGVLQRELDRYPPGTLTNPEDPVLTSVMVFNRLKTNDRFCLGTYLFGIVFISAGTVYGPPGLLDDAVIARTLHHELSSLFRMSYPFSFDEERFRAQLPPGFVYADERPGANPAVIFEGWNKLGSLEDLSNGFIADYATTSIRQDFNSYAEVLMWRPELLLETFAPESRIGRKARVVRDFYLSIDPRFEEMFRKSDPASPDPPAREP
ncbi:MAG: hypothetical protein ACK4WH_05145, partial [Phycisphaerales bacterium]